MNVLITDIDGTLADSAWRDGIEDFEERSRRASEDNAVPIMVQLVNALHAQDWHIICLTARNERWRMLTNKWLLNNDVECGTLKMRANDDFSTAPEYKEAAVREILKYPDRINTLLIDSRSDVISAYKAAGWTVLQP
jgi:phosphoglycolate phosphatase-like HAD superfamily hydrolase